MRHTTAERVIVPRPLPAPPRQPRFETFLRGLVADCFCGIFLPQLADKDQDRLFLSAGAPQDGNRSPRMDHLLCLFNIADSQ
ncbi:unnamed protein product [Leptosia nina]|uniref:Uncharacterized protein n=1 Tax=Leptosia nina TaxID=320188 RepID=A0AAV1IX88_9NEOP